MTAVRLPRELEAWAEAEVAAGRAVSVEALTARALTGYRRQMEELRASIARARAEADEKGCRTVDEVFDEIERDLEAEIAAEEAAARRASAGA